MKRAAALVTALISATACSVALSACSGGDGDATSMTGRLSSTIPAFCIGDPSATGMCFLTTESSGVKESELAAGDCVRVTYRPPADGQATARATKVERATC